MSRKKEWDITNQNKKWLSEGLILKIAETCVYEYMKNPGKSWKVLNEELDDRNMKQVPLQDFYLRIRERQEELGKCFILYDFDKTKNKRWYAKRENKGYSSKPKTSEKQYNYVNQLVWTLFEYMDS